VLEQLEASITRYDNYVRLRNRTRAASILFSDDPHAQHEDAPDASAKVSEVDQLYVTRYTFPKPITGAEQDPLSQRTFPKLNPVDKQGTPKTCHYCGSIEHFLLE
jgi:hypothetical protein